MMNWINIFKGYLMGICELIPGVSSGTMALLLGIYEQFLGAISRIVSKHFKQAILYLIPLVIGMGAAIVTMSSLIDYLLQNHTVPTHYFFLGMVLGIVPMMFQISNFRTEFKPVHYVLIVSAIVLLIVLANFQGEGADVSGVEVTPSLLVFLFFSGMAGSSVMLLPGISGSLVMLILGAYPVVIYSVSEVTSFNFAVLPLVIAVGLGILSGLLIASRVIYYLLRNYTYLTYALIIGLLIGSVFPIYPGAPGGAGGWSVTISAFMAGFVISSYMAGKNK